MKAGETLRVTIERLGPDGAGIADVDGVALHLAGTTPGDTVDARVDSVSRQHPRAFGSIREVQRGPAYRKSPCHHAAPTAGECGGCPLMHVEDGPQREAKRLWINETLGALGSVDQVIAAPTEMGYRNRANFIVWKSPSGAVRLGSRVPGGKGFARMEGCRVLAEPLATVADAIARLGTELEVPVANTPGGLRYVGLRVDRSGRALVEFVTFGEPDVLLRRLGAAVYNSHDSVVGFVESENRAEGNAIRVERAKAVLGVESLDVDVAGVPLQVWSDTFAQLNWGTADRMARRIAELCAEDEGVIWDLYSGAGILGLAVATRGPQRPVYGIDVTKSAIEGASSAAEKLSVEAHYVAADLRSGLPKGWPEPGVILLNPPRKGLHRAISRRVANAAAPLVYMSCNPASFARDAAVFVEAGRSIERIEAYEMLPQTGHVELLARFSAPVRAPGQSPDAVGSEEAVQLEE